MMNRQDAMDFVSRNASIIDLYDLSIHLGLGDAVVTRVWIDNHRIGITEVIYQLLIEWRNRFASNATVDVLATALHVIGRDDLARQIQPNQNNERNGTNDNKSDAVLISGRTMGPTQMQLAMFMVQKELAPGNLRPLSEALGLSTVAAIKYDNVYIQLAIREVLIQWEHANGQAATIEALAKALEKIKENQLVENIYEALGIHGNSNREAATENVGVRSQSQATETRATPKTRSLDHTEETSTSRPTTTEIKNENTEKSDETVVDSNVTEQLQLKGAIPKTKNKNVPEEVVPSTSNYPLQSTNEDLNGTDNQCCYWKKPFYSLGIIVIITSFIYLIFGKQGVTKYINEMLKVIWDNVEIPGVLGTLCGIVIIIILRSWSRI